jgi:hypothetical protein
MSDENKWYLPASMPSCGDDEADAASFAEHMRALREHEPPAGEPDVVEVEVSDGVRSERVRVRMAPGPWPTWTFEVK